MSSRVPTAPIAATGLIAGYGVAVSSGSRLLGGLVLGLFALVCVAVWAIRDERRTVAVLVTVGFGAFALSHLLGMIVGPWPAVLIVAAVTFAACWQLSDGRHLGRPPRVPRRG